MASQPISPATDALDPEEKRLTRDEGWDLIFSLFGTAKEMYAPYGGGEAWPGAPSIRRELRRMGGVD